MTDQNSYSARIYGTSGALKDLLEKIDSPRLLTLEDVLQFRKKYVVIRKKMLNDSIAQVKQNLARMNAEIKQLTLERDELVKSKSEELKQTISRLEADLSRTHNFFTAIYYKIIKLARTRKIKYFKTNFQAILRSTTQKHDKRIEHMENKIKFTKNHIHEMAEDTISSELNRLDKLSNTIENEKYLLYGAIGETKVINELKKLPKTYRIICMIHRHRFTLFTDYDSEFIAF